MYILFDIGGTKTRIAGAENKTSFGTPLIFDTPQSYEEGLKALESAIREIALEVKIEKIIGGIAGPIDEKRESLVRSPNLPQWIGKTISKDLGSIFTCPVELFNDSALVGLGEALYGAGRDHEIVAYMTISTGVGGVRIVKGHIDSSFQGFEPGHQIIDADETLVAPSQGADLEHLVSGRFVEERIGKRPADITDEAFWEEQAKLIAYGLNNTIVHWSPDVVVLGGSMMNEVGVSVEKVEQYLKDILTIFPKIPPIKKALLGDVGGLYGALASIDVRS